jgi:hypothetical protein
MPWGHTSLRCTCSIRMVRPATSVRSTGIENRKSSRFRRHCGRVRQLSPTPTRFASAVTTGSAA